MGFLADLFGFNQPLALPIVTSILPDAAKQEILNDRLPQLNTDKIFLRKGERIHYIDKAIRLTEKVHKKVRTHNRGVSMPGIFKGDRVHFGEGTRDVDEQIETIQTRGILYITNQRVIFQAQNNTFDKKYQLLSTVEPYSNAIELQYGDKNYSLLVSDGNIPYRVIRMIQQRRAF